MKVFNLNNFGYVEDKIPKKLFNSLLQEIRYAESRNPDMISDLTLTNTDIVKHKVLVDNKNELLNYLSKPFDVFNSYYPGLANIGALTRDLPFAFGEPWINYQRKGEYVPNHKHDGIYSYTIWMKIPTKCKFEFTYTNVLGNIMFKQIYLTKKDEGKIIFFPAKLPHIAYPFNDSNDVRVSISGNIRLNSDG